MLYFTDVHGDRQLFDAAINLIGTDKFIFGGDACDRGKDGYAIMKELLSNPNCLYLKGNHEDMFVKAAYQIRQHIVDGDFQPEQFQSIAPEFMYSDTFGDEDIALSLYNGGLSTLTSWINDGMDMKFIQAIQNLPTHYSIAQYDFCHAGCACEIFERGIWSPNEEYDVLWCRTHFNFAWTPERMLIHGHTPVGAMPNKWRCNYAPVLYCGGGKLNMDAGAHYMHQLFVWEIGTTHFWRILPNDVVVVINPMDRTYKPYFNLKTGESYNVGNSTNSSNNNRNINFINSPIQ